MKKSEIGGIRNGGREKMDGEKGIKGVCVCV